MQREIKFRARRTDNRRWVYGSYFTTPLTDENSGTEPNAGWFLLSDGEIRHCIGQGGVAFTIDPETVGQFTGLRDSNGVEIYEGDIVDARTDDVWRDACRDVSDPVVVEWLPIGYYRGFLGYAKGKVLGNIYENPELYWRQNERTKDD